MSLFTMDSGACRQCTKNGKCEHQKKITKTISTMLYEINNDAPDDEVVGTVILTCNRGGE